MTICPHAHVEVSHGVEWCPGTGIVYVRQDCPIWREAAFAEDRESSRMALIVATARAFYEKTSGMYLRGVVLEEPEGW